jgi:hypothetical protein
MAQLPDSGERREFATGSARDKVDGKGAFHLLSPFALRAYAKRMEDGMSKYGERNWEKGQPVMTYLDSGLRHINDYVADCMLGRVPEEDHLGAALWNIAAAIHTLTMLEHGLLPHELDNRPEPPEACNYGCGSLEMDHRCDALQEELEMENASLCSTPSDRCVPRIPKEEKPKTDFGEMSGRQRCYAQNAGPVPEEEKF